MISAKEVLDDHQNDLGPIAYLAASNLINEDNAVNYVAEQLGLKIFNPDPSSAALSTTLLDDPKLKSISLSDWRIIRAVPVKIEKDLIWIAFSNPLDLDARSRLEFVLQNKIQLMVVKESYVKKILSRQGVGSDSFELDEILSTASGDMSRARTSSESHVIDPAVFGDDLESPPVIRLANKILSESVERGASDIHIEPEKGGLNVKNRIDGIIHQLFTVPQQLQSPVISRLKLLAGMDISERRKPQDGRFRIKTSLGIRDLRVSSVPTVYGETLVIRVLSSDINKLEFESLGMPLEISEILTKALRGSSRVILVTGPTGAGKTSTLYSCIQYLADGERKIITIEDPIEYRVGGINQIQVNPKIGLTFAEGLKTIVRQDPDVVMVGEIRDQETAMIGMQVAQTGHLVISSFHTNTAPAAVTRLRDFGVAPYVLSSALGTIVAQRLVRKLCNLCSKEPSNEDQQKLKNLGIDPTHSKSPQGCSECNQIGFKGRIGIYSILDISEDVREAIRTGPSEREIVKLASKGGYISLEESARRMIASGTTTLGEVERVLGPLANSEEEKIQGRNNPREKSDTKGAPLNKRKVLLVEDSEDTRAVLEMLLKREFYEVVTAEDGFSALEKVFAEMPELIISDLMMPRMSGLEMLQKLRNDVRTRDIPVLMLTAAGDEESELKMIHSGADDFVRKGSDTKVLLARVQRLLNKSPATT